MVPLFTGRDELEQLDKIHGVLGTPSQKLLEKFTSRSEKYKKHKFTKKKAVGLHKMLPMLSDHGVHLLNKMLGYHPDSRITAKRLSDHIYFADLKKQSDVVSHIRLSASVTKIDRSSLSTCKNSVKSLSNTSLASKISSIPARPTCPSIRKTQSLNVSRESSYIGQPKTATNLTVKKVQSQLNKDRERAWGMNSCKSKHMLVAKAKKPSAVVDLPLGS